MPITRRTSERKKSEICTGESAKENVEVKRTVKGSKVKPLEKIEENIREESPSFTVKGKEGADAFDVLCSSPLKQEVNFKPLSFWSKKVKDLECKENGKKKKFELYELSETDDSSSVEGKRTKKRGRPPGRRPKNTGKKANKVPYHFDAKTLMKKKVEKNKMNENKEGSIIRERIILQRLNNNCLDKEDKFSFNKVNAFGLTSTPGRKQRLNIVGGSNFDFLSPIPVCADKSIVGETNCKGEQVRESVVQGSPLQNENLVTPKKSKIKGVSENVVTRDLKRVSEYDISRNVTLVDASSEMDNFPKDFSQLNSSNSIYGQGSFECCNVKTEDTTIDLHQMSNEENQMNVTFLDIYEDEVESEEDCDISHFRITDYIVGCHYIDQNFNSKVFYNETDMIKSLVSLKVLLKILCITFDCEIDTTLSSRSSFVASTFPGLPAFVHSMSLPVGEDHMNVSSITNWSLDLGLDINESGTRDSSVNSFCENTQSSFRYVQVRRPCNFFLNFRGSAKEEEFNVSCEKVKNCEKQDVILQDIANLDSINDNERYRISDSFETNSSTAKENACNSSHSENKTCNIKGLANEESTLTETFDRFEMEDQQTHMDDTQSNLTLVRNGEMRSNQYRSKNAEFHIRGESKEMCFTVGNDSSIILSPEMDREEDVDCSICKNKVGESRKCSKTEASSEELKDPSGSEATKADSDMKNVTCFRVVGGMRQYKKQITEKSEESESDRSSLSRVDSPIVKSAPVGNVLAAEFTFNDESDFPLPIFESTTCGTPVAKKNASRSLSDRSGKDSELSVVSVREVSRTRDGDGSEPKIEDVTSFHLKPGKKWARSAIILKKALNGTLVLDETSSPKRKGRRFRTLVEEVLCMQTDVPDGNTIASCTSIASITERMSNLTMGMKNFGNRTVKVLENDGKENSFQSIFRSTSTFEKFHSTTMKTAEECSELSAGKEDMQYFSARDLVLMRCNQEAPLPFEEHFNKKTLKNCKKIGEGTFGEVFMCSPNRVIKIMPIEGPDEVNGEPQKKFDEIITEMVVAMELSNLRHTEKYRTSGFSELKRCWCVIGEYPQYLIDLWNDFDCAGNGSENDSPEMFKSDQLYVILEFSNGGQDLEAFVFNSAEQSHSIFIQVAFSLAAAERVLEFEHRDMHWGNILVNHTREKYFKVMINGKEYKIPTKGVKVTIIDFTLSRISYEGCSIFNDLSQDLTLFTAQGDYQFEIYRMMKEEVMNDWSVYRPRTNLFWLHYVLDKMLTMVRYKKTDSKIHRIKLLKFSELKSSILDYRDSEDFILNTDLL